MTNLTSRHMLTGILSRGALVILACLSSLAACASRGRPQNIELRGAYRFEDGRLVSIRASVGKTLRARFYDSGTSRRLAPAGELRFVTGPEFSASKPVESVIEFERGANGGIRDLVWRDNGRQEARARRVNRTEYVRFESNGAMLSGRLDLPNSAGGDRLIGAVVLVHGSGSDAATDFFYAGDFLAAHGVAALTYDKRGTGASEGEYTFDFDQLARDAVAAVDYLNSRSELRGLRVGLSGYSQGAWVAPLAATKDDRVRFVIASYGLVASPIEEARVETRNLLRAQGVGESDLADVDELTLAAVEIVASGFEQGWEEFRATKKRLRGAPWLKHLRGTTVGRFVRYPTWLIRLLGPRLAPKGLPWHYDSMSVLEELEIPMTWLLAEKDTSAPLELALPMLESLQAGGKAIDVRVFPGAGHGMLLLPRGYAPGYFPAEVEAVIRYCAEDPSGVPPKRHESP